MKLRTDQASIQYSVPVSQAATNPDEQAIYRYAACFSKCLPTTQSGEAEPGTYESLLRAIESGKHSDFEAIHRGSGRRLVNPQAAFSYCFEVGDPQRFACPLFLEPRDGRRNGRDVLALPRPRHPVSRLR